MRLWLLRLRLRLRQHRERVALKERIEAELRAHCASMLDLVTKKLLVGAEADSLKKVACAVAWLGEHQPAARACMAHSPRTVRTHTLRCTDGRPGVLPQDGGRLPPVPDRV